MIKRKKAKVNPPSIAARGESADAWNHPSDSASFNAQRQLALGRRIPKDREKAIQLGMNRANDLGEELEVLNCQKLLPALTVILGVVGEAVRLCYLIIGKPL